MRTSTERTPGSAPTRSRAARSNSALTGHAGVVSSIENATRSPSMRRSFTKPRSTMLLPKSGSTIGRRASRTAPSSRRGDMALLRSPQRSEAGAARSRARLARDDARDAARDQGRDVGQHEGQREGAGRGQVARLPDRRELVLERAQPLEVVEMLAVSEQDRPEPIPERSEPVALEAGERRHPEAEPAVALRLAPEGELREEILHDPGRRVGAVAHQIDRELLFRVSRPHVRERHHLPSARHHREGRALQVLAIEEAEREALLARLLAREPRVRDRLEPVEKGRHGGRRDDLERASLPLRAVVRLAQALALPACEREARERYARLLAELAQREPEVEVHGEVLGAHLVEGRDPAVLIR